MDDSTGGSYDIILDRDIHTALKLDLIFPNTPMKGAVEHNTGYVAPIVDLGTYEYRPLNITDKITPEEFLMYAYV